MRGKDETHSRNAAELREREALRDVNERKKHGRWMGNRLAKQTGRGRRRRRGVEGEQRGTVETEGRTKYILRLSLSVRATRLAVATRRSIDVPRRRSSRSLRLAFSISLHHPSCPPSRRLRYIREGGIIEIARRRLHQTKGEGYVGSAGFSPRTSGYRSATPLCSFPLPSREPLPLLLSTGSVCSRLTVPVSFSLAVIGSTEEREGHALSEICRPIDDTLQG